MNTRVYPNTGGSVPSIDTISTTSQPPLALFAEDRITITDTFLRHLAHCQLSPRQIRIIMAVFNQTLGFNKFEDDMNGVRLQQLTGISANHANSTVRDLEQLKVLIKRKGKYGHYLSINFDFAQWGQIHCTETPNNDPCCLLPDVDESDTGLDLRVESDQQPLEEEEKEENEENEAEAVNHLSDETPAEPAVEPSLKIMAQQAVADIATLKEELIALLDSIKTLSERVEQLEKQGEKDQQPHVQQQPIVATSTVQDKPQTQSPSQPPISTTAPPMLQNTVSTTCLEANPLRYPDSFSANQRQQAAKSVQPAGDKAQLLLDMLSKRMAKQHDPLRQPLSYLDTLVERLQNKQLTFTEPKVAFVSSTSSTTGFVPPPPSKEEQCRAEYREAAADCLHMERNIKMLAAQKNTSFEETLIKSDLEQWWEDIKQRFYDAKAALAELQMGDAVAV